MTDMGVGQLKELARGKSGRSRNRNCACSSFFINILSLAIPVLWIEVLTDACTHAGEPHAWIASAPGEFVRLIDRGSVRIEVDDQRVNDANKAALTVFQFKTKYDSKFRYEWVAGDQRDTWKARIVATLRECKVTLDHTIVLKSSFQPTEPWQTRLVKHEFDHVAISTDPRALKIIDRFLRRKRVWVAEWQQPDRPSENDVRDRLKEQVEADVKQIELLIQTQYDWLDQQSNEGLASLVDRFEFFNELYSPDGLKRCGFDTELMGSDHSKKRDTSAQDIERHYLDVQSP
jgi:hypothetical protein